MMYLDLSELEEVFRGHWFWASRRLNLAWFRRKDHLGSPGEPLEDSVREMVQAECGFRPTGPIILLTHLRYFGYVMNPVSFYYCWDEDEDRLEAIAGRGQASVDQVRRMFQENGRLERIEADLREEKVVEFLVQQADIQTE